MLEREPHQHIARKLHVQQLPGRTVRFAAVPLPTQHLLSSAPLSSMLNRRHEPPLPHQPSMCTFPSALLYTMRMGMAG